MELLKYHWGIYMELKSTQDKILTPSWRPKWPIMLSNWRPNFVYPQKSIVFEWEKSSFLHLSHEWKMIILFWKIFRTGLAGLNFLLFHHRQSKILKQSTFAKVESLSKKKYRCQKKIQMGEFWPGISIFHLVKH